MTTTVHIAVQGNKAVEVIKSDSSVPNITLLPGQFCTLLIHGDVTLTAKEIGGFIDGTSSRAAS